MNHVSYLEFLEQEAKSIIEVAYSSLDNLGILFSGGKDSCVVRHLVNRAMPEMKPVLLSIDTGYSFAEVDKFFTTLDYMPEVRTVESSIQAGLVPPRAPGVSRNADQSVTLKHALNEFKFQGVFCGARRDEDRARAKERVFSHRDSSGNWRPENQRMEMYGYLTDMRLSENEHFRIFPISNWTELDVWEYIAKYDVKIPSIYYAHQRPGYEGTVRFRTVGDTLVTKPVASTAMNAEEVFTELLSASISERGATRLDDKDMSMEQRKLAGYF